jgi:transcriptional regulator with XRE-family HTH domain
MNAFDASDPSLPMDTMGARIRAVRRKWGWSQEEVARALRVDQASISFWERDKVRPSGSALVALASLFRTNVRTLEEGTGFKLPDAPFSPEDGKGQGQPRSISLPVPAGEGVTIVDLDSGSFKESQLSEAMMGMVQSVKDCRRVWLVLE